MNQYGQILIDQSVKLDGLTSDSYMFSDIAKSLVEKGIEDVSIELCAELAKVSNMSDGIRKQAKEVKDSLLMYYGYEKLYQIFHPENSSDSVQNEEVKSLEELLNDLDKLVGLESVKKQIRNLIAYSKVQQLRRKIGLMSEKVTHHVAFLGNPGTGKTTVARIIGQIYKHLGILSKGHFLEVSRTDLIAGYQGQTALKVKKIVDRAKGGVLFIDEAYSITENENSDAYGRECLTELTKALEDYRDDLVVIVAGYTEPMNIFFNSNPGLKSRFSTFIEFPDYNSSELMSILQRLCVKNSYKINEDALMKIQVYIDESVDQKEEKFGNGRFVRNLFDKLVMNHANRVCLLDSPSIQDLTYIQVQDVDALRDSNCMN